MGGNQSFEHIEKKYGQKGTDYIAAKYQERKIYERINDEIQRLVDHANLQETGDIEFIHQQKLRLEKAFTDAKAEAQAKKKGAIQEAQALHKHKVEDFSGYNQKRVSLQNLEKQVKTKYATQRVRMQEKVREEVRKHQSGSSTFNNVPEYDNYPDNYRRTIENQCVVKYPAKAKQVDATQLEKKLTWDNYKQKFVGILNRDQVKKDVDAGCEHIKENLVPGGAPICC